MQFDNFTVILVLVLFACAVFIIRGFWNSMAVVAEQSRTAFAPQTWQRANLPPVGPAFHLRAQGRVAWTTFANTVELIADAKKAGNFKLIPCTDAKGWYVLESIDAGRLVACVTPLHKQGPGAPLTDPASFHMKCVAETSKTMACPKIEPKTPIPVPPIFKAIGKALATAINKNKKNAEPKKQEQKQEQKDDVSDPQWTTNARLLVKPIVKHDKLLFQGPDIGEKAYFWTTYVDSYGVETDALGLTSDASKALEFAWKKSL